MTPPLAPPARPPNERLGARLFTWTQAPATPAIVALGLAMAVATLVGLEAVAPRQGAGAGFDRGIGTYAGFGAAGAVLLIGVAALLRRIPGAKAAEDDDADQP